MLLGRVLCGFVVGLVCWAAVVEGDIIGLSVQAKYEEMVILPTQVGMFDKLNTPWGDRNPYVELRGKVHNYHDWNATLVITVEESKNAMNRLNSPCGLTGGHQVEIVPPGESTLFLQEPIVKTGWYAILVTECPCKTASGEPCEPNSGSQSASTGDVRLIGEQVSLNPFGYIPGEKYHMLPFFGILCLAYMGLGILWAGTSVLNYKSVMALQHCIAVVIALGFWELVFRYFDYWEWNKKGRENMVTAVFGILFNALKETMSRMLVLAVSMGYGVVKPSLGTDKYKVFGLGAVFFVTDAINSLHNRLDTRVEEKPSFAFAFAVVIPQALANALFFYWTFVELARCIHHLEKRRQWIKLTMYKTFTAALGIALGLSLLLLSIQSLVVLGTSHKATADNWRYLWVFEAYWELIYAAVLVVVCVIWRPSVASTRYAYQQTDDQDIDPNSSDDEEISIPLAGVTAPLSRKNAAPASSSAGGPPPPPAADNPRTATSLFTAAAFKFIEDEETEALEANKIE